MALSQAILVEMKRIETIRLYPTARQEAALAHVLHVTRHLYNAALQQRKDAYRLGKIRVSAKMQYAEVTALRKESFQLAAFIVRPRTRYCIGSILPLGRSFAG